MSDLLVPDYAPAPPVRRRAAAVYVLQSGLATTAATLFGLWWLGGGERETFVMGWYANYVIPIGALLVGVVAGSGYGLASWYAGVRVGLTLLLVIAALQFAGYFVAQYIDFRAQGPFYWDDTGLPVTFWQWFHENTMAFAWEPNHTPAPGQTPILDQAAPEPEPLGWWGYFFVGLGVAGGLVAPALLRLQPYCDPCGRYMKTTPLATLAASVPARKFKKAQVEEAAAHDAEQQAAGRAGGEQVDRLMVLAAAGDAEGFRAEATPAVAARKANAKLPRRIDLSLVACRGCQRGFLTANVASGHGNNQSTTELGRTDVTPEFVEAVSRE